MTKFTESIRLPASDELHLNLEVDQSGTIQSAKLLGVGSSSMHHLLEKWRGQLKGSLAQLPLPNANSGPEMMLRELILKIKGQFVNPYPDAEVCHCRVVSTEMVRHSIFMGAHTPEQVSMMTSASTACGTCRKDVESILKSLLVK